MTNLPQFLTLALERSWLKGSRLAWLFAPVLWPLSKLIWYALRLHAFARPAVPLEPLGVPLLVVGNVFVGGVGKTPLVIALTLHFKSQGLQVAVISRGYSPKGTQSSHAPRLVTPLSQAKEVGDEPLMIFERTGVPVCVGTHRLKAAQHVLQMHPQLQLIISDDGLQNDTLSPEMTVCVFDDRGTGNGWTLPPAHCENLGPGSKACTRANVLLFNGSSTRVSSQKSKAFAPNGVWDTPSSMHMANAAH